jgi:hypothetical protein
LISLNDACDLHHRRLNSDEEIISECEVFNIRTYKVTPMASLNFPSIQMGVCIFNNGYIVKVGGRFKNN